MVPDRPFGVGQDPLVGQVLSQRYRILAKLGEGAMAAVYLAEHTGVGKTIVLKVLLPELASEPNVVESFLREARIAAEIQHDNVIDIFYSGRSPEGQVFLAMEYIEGSTLYAVLAKEGALPWKRAHPMLLQIASALAAAHKQGVVHRDIKPENVLLGTKETPDGPLEFIKVVDFGIANARGDSSMGVCGTPEFMSPQQAQGMAPDARDDIYAFGCLMYQVLTGDVPFREADVAKILLMQMRDPPVPPRDRRPDLAIPQAAQDVVMRALEKQREDRWQSMSDLELALEGAAVTIEPPAPPPQPPARIPTPRIKPAGPVGAANLRARIAMPREREPRRSRLPLILGAVVVLGGAAAGFVQHTMTHAPGRIEILTDPPEAEIYIDGQKMTDRSPMFLDASPGTYKVMVRSAGYEPLEAEVVMKPRASDRVTLPLKALPLPKPPPVRRAPSAGAPSVADSRRRVITAPPGVNGVTFIDFKKSAAEQKAR
jgi:tRNA A-37 threonylcarbamoyl transferase component Bud32